MANKAVDGGALMSRAHVGFQTEDMYASAEMNHRICNNLALLASIIQVDGRTVDDPHAAFVLDMTRRRLHAIASVHRRLYRSELLATLDLGLFLEELGEDLRDVCEHSERRRLRIETESVPISAESAAAFGMLVVELVGNACKHAYAIDEPGEVRVALRATQIGGWQLVVEDDGIGIGERSDIAAGLGSRIVEATARRLGGHFRWEKNAPGTRFILWVEGSKAPIVTIDAATGGIL